MKSRFNKVYVLAPANHATGGVELAHQLVDVINNYDGEAYIVYEKDNKIIPNLPVTSAYSSYNIKVANEIEDSNNNILILPEIYFDYIYRFKNINFGLWWMSVDNHYYCANWTDLRYSPGSFIHKLKLLRGCTKKRFRNTISDLKKIESRTIHFYQSAYAQNHIYNLKFSRVFPLKDYVNMDFINSEKNSNLKREDIVLYNPAKGFKFTRKIIKANPGIKFVPLKNLNRYELRKLMQTAKLYIDFGNFPGKDRLPRESVMNGTCIISGRYGASRFYEDLPIDDKYKFNACSSSINKISKLIQEIFSDYSIHSNDFEFYRSQIKKERDEFYQEIQDFFFK